MNPKAVREFFHCIMFIPTLHFPTCHSNGFSITWRGFRAVDDRHDNMIRFHHWIYTEWSFAKWVTCENASVVSQWNIFNTISAFISPVLSIFVNKTNKKNVGDLRPWWYMRFEEDLFCLRSGPCGCCCPLMRSLHAG